MFGVDKYLTSTVRIEESAVKDNTRVYSNLKISKLAKSLMDAGVDAEISDNPQNSLCNAADIDSYKGFVPDFARDNMCGKTISIVCFEIAPEYRGQGIASAFIEQVCVDAKAKGYVAVEGYAKVIEHRDEYNFTGPIHLYEKAGFSQIIEQNGVAVMRKLL